MKRGDDTVYLRHMLDAISRIQEYTRDISYDQFLTNPLVQDGVIRQLEILGEAANSVSELFCEAHPDIT